MQTPADLSPAAVFAVIGIAGFAVQRAVEFFDPFVSAVIRGIRSSKTVPPALDPWETEIKKTILLLLSLGLACVIVAITEVRLLSLIPEMPVVEGDFFVTALVLSAGTESINSLQKYFGYIKDARNPALVNLTVTPVSAESTPSNRAVQFISIVRNSPNKLVEWKKLSGPGTIDQNGLYVGGSPPGTAQIAAISQANPSAVGTATVKVT